jgi:hypothetical protein
MITFTFFSSKLWVNGWFFLFNSIGPKTMSSISTFWTNTIINDIKNNGELKIPLKRYLGTQIWKPTQFSSKSHDILYLAESPLQNCRLRNMRRIIAGDRASKCLWGSATRSDMPLPAKKSIETVQHMHSCRMHWTAWKRYHSCARSRTSLKTHSRHNETSPLNSCY